MDPHPAAPVGWGGGSSPCSPSGVGWGGGSSPCSPSGVGWGGGSSPCSPSGVGWGGGSSPCSPGEVEAPADPGLISGQPCGTSNLGVSNSDLEIRDRRNRNCTQKKTCCACTKLTEGAGQTLFWTQAPRPLDPPELTELGGGADWRSPAGTSSARHAEGRRAVQMCRRQPGYCSPELHEARGTQCTHYSLALHARDSGYTSGAAPHPMERLPTPGNVLS